MKKEQFNDYRDLFNKAKTEMHTIYNEFVKAIESDLPEQKVFVEKEQPKEESSSSEIHDHFCYQHFDIKPNEHSSVEVKILYSLLQAMDQQNQILQANQTSIQNLAKQLESIGTELMKIYLQL